jgi:hypothetical protein
MTRTGFKTVLGAGPVRRTSGAGVRRRSALRETARGSYLAIPRRLRMRVDDTCQAH